MCVCVCVCGILRLHHHIFLTWRQCGLFDLFCHNSVSWFSCKLRIFSSSWPSSKEADMKHNNMTLKPSSFAIASCCGGKIKGAKSSSTLFSLSSKVPPHETFGASVQEEIVPLEKRQHQNEYDGFKIINVNYLHPVQLRDSGKEGIPHVCQK